MVDVAHRSVGSISPFRNNTVARALPTTRRAPLNIMASTRGPVIAKGALIRIVQTYDALLHQLHNMLEKHLAYSGLPLLGCLYPQLAWLAFLPCRPVCQHPVLKACLPSSQA